MRAAGGGRALHELQSIGQEHAHEWPDLNIQQALDRRAVDAHALDRLRTVGQHPEAHAQLVCVGAVEQAHDDARGLRPETHELAVVACARGSRGAAVVQRLEEVRLARAVGAVNDGQALAQAGFGAAVRAEVAQLHAEDAHVGCAGHRVTRSGGSA